MFLILLPIKAKENQLRSPLSELRLQDIAYNENYNARKGIELLFIESNCSIKDKLCDSDNAQ